MCRRHIWLDRHARRSCQSPFASPARPPSWPLTLRLSALVKQRVEKHMAPEIPREDREKGHRRQGDRCRCHIHDLANALAGQQQAREPLNRRWVT